MPINEVHLNALLETIPQFQNQGSFGHVPRKFLNRIITRIGINNTSQSLIDIRDELPEDFLNRNRLFEICNNDNYSIAYQVVCVFAWGNMTEGRNASDLFFRNWDNYEKELEHVIQNFRNNSFTRNWAYERIRIMGTQGCGPAYYTKLLFFFGDGNTYIMDQWTAKSIELLWMTNDRISIRFNQGLVHKHNHSGIYEEFCCRIEQLTAVINNRLNLSYSAIDVEELIFSNGEYRGQIRGQWRQYLINNW
jgi:hypothetical protein